MTAITIAERDRAATEEKENLTCKERSKAAIENRNISSRPVDAEE
jgi:hypothetical protein